MAISRRALLTATPAVATLGWAAPETTATSLTPLSSGFDPWVEVNADHLRHNVRQVSSRVSGRPILGVIKNNGYGGGLVEVARLLAAEREIAGLAVVKLREAMVLRQAGVQKPILLMGPCDEKELGEAVGAGITPMVYTPVGPALERIAVRRRSAVAIHVCVDTGIGRVGVPHGEAPDLIKDLAGRPSIRIEGTMMTFTEDPEFDQEQLRRFRTLCQTLAAEGVALGRLHAASSFALFQHPDSFLDMVRPGMVLYGIYPEQTFRGAGSLDLKPALALRARVIYVKKLRQGDSAGYNRAYVAPEDVWVATLPVGHADGLPRAAAKGARVRIGDAMYPLIASVSASHSIVEVGPEPRVKAGDVATIFDWREGSRPEDVSAACGVSVYDLTMHLNPLLPRHVVPGSMAPRVVDASPSSAAASVARA